MEKFDTARPGNPAYGSGHEPRTVSAEATNSVLQIHFRSQEAGLMYTHGLRFYGLRGTCWEGRLPIGSNLVNIARINVNKARSNTPENRMICEILMKPVYIGGRGHLAGVKTKCPLLPPAPNLST